MTQIVLQPGYRLNNSDDLNANFNNAGLDANGTATATSGAATLNGRRGTVTSESLTTAAAAEYTLTITNSSVKATSIVMASWQTGTNTTVSGVFLTTVTPSAGQVVIVLHNGNAGALNGTVQISFVVLN